MKIEYYIISDEEDSKRFAILDIDNDNEQIGTVEGDLLEYGSLQAVVHIYQNYQKKGLGFQAFKKIYDEFNSKNKITKIIGNWNQDEEFSYCEEGKSTNLRIFLNCSEKHNDLKYCAFKTPTGKWAYKLGFTECQVIRCSNEKVEVKFTKQNND